MCLTIEKTAKRKFTFKSTVVYKFVMIDDELIYTPFQYQLIEFNKIYHSILKRNIDPYGNGTDTVDEGLHSLLNRRSAENMANKWHNHKAIKCIIPAFSFYYEGTFGDNMSALASTKIKYLNFI